jgi:hypothetical protein
MIWAKSSRATGGDQAFTALRIRFGSAVVSAALVILWFETLKL